MSRIKDALLPGAESRIILEGIYDKRSGSSQHRPCADYLQDAGVTSTAATSHRRGRVILSQESSSTQPLRCSPEAPRPTGACGRPPWGPLLVVRPLKTHGFLVTTSLSPGPVLIHP